MKKPLIGITSGFAESNTSRIELPGLALDYLKNQYSQRVLSAGGLPFIIPNVRLPENADQILEPMLKRIDGLLLSGGYDISPQIYAEQEIHPNTIVREQRDCFEMPLLKYALDKTNIPIFAICRGHQLLNVALGGALWQDIELFRANLAAPEVILEHRRIHDENGVKQRVWHSVEIRQGTLLFSIVRRRRIVVNSSHHQFVREVGNGLTVSAIAPDGAIEATEIRKDQKRFILSVQWHPEAMDDDIANALFNAFVRAAVRT